LLPAARTYHATALVKNFMTVISGEGRGDLKDFWILDLERGKWFNPDVQAFDSFTPKRFHTACTINDTQVVTFGGCHSDYVFMNEMHIFQLADFVSNPVAG
jgi:hypothetical protein